MKIYCILNDSISLGNILEPYLKDKGFHHFTQISNYFSNTSVISLLTGKLPSDLEKGGIGYHTHFNYKVNGKIEYPWKEQLMIHKLYKKGWDIHFINAPWFYLTTCSDDFIKKTTVKESEEKEFIQKIQAEKTDKNTFHLFKNNQYHNAISHKSNKTKALEEIKQSLSYWDFEEEDALFYIFSDHPNCLTIHRHCIAPNMLTWACVKDNTRTLGDIKRNYIHIKDFNNLNIITENEEEGRIYFTEDARCELDSQKSTTAVACKFIDWVDNKAKQLVQVSYFRPENKFYGYLYNLNTKKIGKVNPDLELAEALKGRFEWVK